MSIKYIHTLSLCPKRTNAKTIFKAVETVSSQIFASILFRISH